MSRRHLAICSRMTRSLGGTKGKEKRLMNKSLVEEVMVCRWSGNDDRRAMVVKSGPAVASTARRRELDRRAGKRQRGGTWRS